MEENSVDIKKIVDEQVAKLEKSHSPEDIKKAKDLVIRVIDEGIPPLEGMGFSQRMIDAMYGAGFSMYESGKYDQACNIFKYLRLLNPTDFRYTFGIAACFHQMKQYEAALANYIMCNLLEPNDPLPLFHSADCLIRLNDPKGAMKSLRRTIKATEGISKFDLLRERAQMSLKKLKKEYLTETSTKKDSEDGTKE